MRLSLVSSALYTTPMPPSPSFSRTLYCRMVWPIMEGNLQINKGSSKRKGGAERPRMRSHAERRIEKIDCHPEERSDEGSHRSSTGEILRCAQDDIYFFVESAFSGTSTGRSIRPPHSSHEPS